MEKVKPPKVMMDVLGAVREPETAVGMQMLQAEEDSNTLDLIPEPTLNDELYSLVSMSSSPTGKDVFVVALKELASEIASLGAYRDAQYRAGLNITNTSEKRIKGLKTFAELASLMNKADAGKVSAEVDFYGEPFKRVFGFFTDIVIKSLSDSNIDQGKVAIFMNRFANNMVGFEDKAKRLYNGESLEDVNAEFHGEL